MPPCNLPENQTTRPLLNIRGWLAAKKNISSPGCSLASRQGHAEKSGKYRLIPVLCRQVTAFARGLRQRLFVVVRQMPGSEVAFRMDPPGCGPDTPKLGNALVQTKASVHDHSANAKAETPERLGA